MKKKTIIYSSLILLLSVVIILGVLCTNAMPIYASFECDVTSGSTVLIERESGKILQDKNAHEKKPIASVTKLMTILLTLEKIDAKEMNVNDKILVSKNASGMGGSQIFLDANEQYEVGQLLKSVIVASANDSSVALAEHISGSEKNFLSLMNERAKELGMKNTNYANCTGLPSNEGYSTAYDQALLLNEVLKYDLYHEYSSVWLEDFVHPSGRTTEMTNTNKLSRFYDGCIGGKTGSTNQAKYCLAVGAKRQDMSLIAVVLGVDNSKDRFKLASELLNYGFDNFTTKTLFSNNDLVNKTIEIKGQDRSTSLIAERNYVMVVGRDEQVNFTLNYNLPNRLAKVTKGEVVGNVDIVVDGVVVDTINILSNETHDEASIWDYFLDLVKI